MSDPTKDDRVTSEHEIEIATKDEITQRCEISSSEEFFNLGHFSFYKDRPWWHPQRVMFILEHPFTQIGIIVLVVIDVLLVIVELLFDLQVLRVRIQYTLRSVRISIYNQRQTLLILNIT